MFNSSSNNNKNRSPGEPRLTAKRKLNAKSQARASPFMRFPFSGPVKNVAEYVKMRAHQQNTAKLVVSVALLY